MNSPQAVTIVGAGASGVSTARALRQAGYGGSVVMVGDEAEWPYDRPPLSKQVLQGEWTPEKGRLFTEEDARRLDIQMRTGMAATSLNVAKRTVHFDKGSPLSADAVVIATGVRPRPHPGIATGGAVHILRTAAEATALAAQLRPGIRVTLIGAGFIGLEVAASAISVGCTAHVLELAPSVLNGRVPSEVATRVQRMHQDNGVVFHLATSVISLTGTPNGSPTLSLSDGTSLEADVVIVAIGTTPNTDWLAESGLDITNGVRCDSEQRAAPGIYAVGDVASVREPESGTHIRHEHRSNASESGLRAACSILGKPILPHTAPSFWTDQYQVKLQLIGRYHPDCTFELAEGDLNAERFLGLFRSGADMVGALGWNMPRQIAAVGRELNPVLAA